MNENSKAFCLGPKSYKFRFTEHIDWSWVTCGQKFEKSESVEKALFLVMETPQVSSSSQPASEPPAQKAFK